MSCAKCKDKGMVQGQDGADDQLCDCAEGRRLAQLVPPARVRVTRDNSEVLLTTIRSGAAILGGTPVVWVTGISGAYMASRVRLALAIEQRGQPKDPLDACATAKPLLVAERKGGDSKETLLAVQGPDDVVARCNSTDDAEENEEWAKSLAARWNAFHDLRAAVEGLLPLADVQAKALAAGRLNEDEVDTLAYELTGSPELRDKVFRLLGIENHPKQPAPADAAERAKEADEVVTFSRDLLKAIGGTPWERL